jgi:hypothetical protein
LTTLNIDLLDALRAAGIDEDTARRAASTVLSLADKDQLATKIEMAEVKGALRLVHWMLGINLALSFAILGKLLAGPG